MAWRNLPHVGLGHQGFMTWKNRNKAFMVAKGLKHVIKMIVGGDYRRTYFETKRLNQLPRYTPTITYLLGNEVQIVDAVTFLGGKKEIFDDEIYRFQIDNPKPFIIDCGANIGMSVIYFKTLCPESTVIAFEADPEIFKALKKNMENFKLENVILENKAIWISDAGVKFQLEGGYSGRIPLNGDRADIIEVKSARLRDLLHKKIDFLKIDIEGAETEVLRDSADLLSNVDLLFVEYHSHIKEPQKLDELLGILTKAGFRYHIKEIFSNPTPFLKRDLVLGMDLQLNIFAYRD
jgi:FkbM family methyltransferase